MRIDWKTISMVKIVELNDTAWFGIHVKSRCEFRAYADLCHRGFEPFLPLMSVRRRWSDRVKRLDLPLFPGYLFCRFSPSDRFKILNAAGVAQIVGTSKGPVPISETEIQSVQTLVGSKVALLPWPYLKAGQLVRVDNGPLTGVEGIVIQAEDGKSRVVVSVTMFQRSVAAEIERDWICFVRNTENILLAKGAA